ALADVADVWLDHDRPIQRPIDDSVVRVTAGRTCVLRLARGLAPSTFSVSLPVDEPIVALGGELKSSLAVYNGGQIALGPYLGDLTAAATCERWEEQLARWQRLYGVEHARLACDMHPDYFSTRWAERSG